VVIGTGTAAFRRAVLRALDDRLRRLDLRGGSPGALAERLSAWCDRAGVVPPGPLLRAIGARLGMPAEPLEALALAADGLVARAPVRLVSPAEAREMAEPLAPALRDLALRSAPPRGAEPVP